MGDNDNSESYATNQPIPVEEQLLCLRVIGAMGGFDPAERDRAVECLAAFRAARGVRFRTPRDARVDAALHAARVIFAG